MLLKNLLFDYAHQIDPEYLNIEISDITTDSRLVRPGAMFFALKGSVVNGEEFIDHAFENGAVAVVCEYHCKGSQNIDPKFQKKMIGVEDVYEVLISVLQKFYPNLPENILAVTGTNGKTSVAYFIQQMQEILGKKSASIGTIGIKTGNLSIQNEFTKFNLTTPDIVSLYKNLTILKQQGINDVAIEASSIGLEQKRLAGLKIGLGAFTNFTQDHLDYHGTMEKYFDSKMLLFKEVIEPGGIAVVNADIAEFEKIKAITSKRGIKSFSYTTKGWVIMAVSLPGNVENVQRRHCDAAIKHGKNNEEMVEILGKQYPVAIKLNGDFQKANILCALLSVIAYYKPNPEQIELLCANLNKINPAEGRMQLVATLKNNARIFIDYAHTPDALQNVLSTAKKIPHKLLYVVFGCGGERDKGKRAKMGKIASDLADYVIVTDDNPRSEDASVIRKEILTGCDLNRTIETNDRETALYQAILILKKDDILIIAGKGHEKYQIIGDKRLPFDENKIIEEFVSSREL